MDSIETRMGKKTIEFHHVSKTIEGRLLINDFDHIVIRDQRLGIIGPNGCGKSTLLKMADGLILPYLKMTGEKEACSFLNSEGRCSIHTFRPGFCRLFPLGRLYEKGSFRYFLQIHECRKENRTKVRVRKWLDTLDFAAYEQFISDWHYMTKELGERIRSLGAEGQEKSKKICLYVLNRFYMEPYGETKGFYEEFYRRLEQAKKDLELKNTMYVQERIKQG